MANDDHKKHEHVIHYMVNGEHESTTEEVLTPRAIMTKAGIDPEENYLELLSPHPESYKDRPDALIEMHDGMRFITKPTGPMPVS